MAYPERGASYKNKPAWLDRAIKAEDESAAPYRQDDDLMGNPALPAPGAPPNPVAPPSSDGED